MILENMNNVIVTAKYVNRVNIYVNNAYKDFTYIIINVYHTVR